MYAIRILVEVINASSLQEQTIRIEGTKGTEQQELVYKITLLCLSVSLSFYLPLLHNIISRQVTFLLYLISMQVVLIYSECTSDLATFCSQRSRWKNQPCDRRGWFIHPRARCHQIESVLGSKHPSLAFLSFRPSSFRSPKRVPSGNSTTACFSSQSSTTHVDDTLTTHNISTQLFESFLMEVTR